jgi:uncharacterized cofD-like protein
VKVTGIGGGHGLSTTLRAARRYATEVNAVVSVADDGGSSGRLTRELGIPPPGDIRNCLVALSDSATTGLWQHRFGNGALSGHTVGNLVIAALTEMKGDFAAAVGDAGLLFGASGRVYPATNELVTLRAEVDGGVVRGQAAVAETQARIRAVHLEPSDPPALAGAVEAIVSADQIVLGPGSLFTSLVAALLVPGIRDALAGAKGRRVYVCNARMQSGETQGLDATEHAEALLAHAGRDSIDTIIVQSPRHDDDGVAVDRRALERLGLEVVEADVATPRGGHDADRLGSVLSSL